MKPSTFCTLIPSKDWGHLLAPDTAGDAIWGHHTQPCAISLRTVSGICSSCRLLSIAMTGNKKNSEITHCNVQFQFLVGVVEGGHQYSGDSCTRALFLFHYWSCDCRRIEDGGNCWDVWDVFFTEVIVSVDLCALNHTPVWWKGRRRVGEGGVFSQINGTHWEGAQTYSSSALIYLPLSTDDASNWRHTHMLSQHFFLYQGLCWFVDRCIFFSCECMCVSVLVCVWFRFFHTLNLEFLFYIM